MLLAALTVALSSLVFGSGSATAAGPALKEPPEGYAYRSRYTSSRKIFPERTVLNQSGYRGGNDGLDGMIVITELSDTTSQHGVKTAQDELRNMWENEGLRFDAVSTTDIDGQDSWYWFERESSGQKLVAVVPYLDATYTIEFESSEPQWQNDLAMLDCVVSFQRDPPSENGTAAFFVSLAVLLGVVVLGRKFQRG